METKKTKISIFLFFLIISFFIFRWFYLDVMYFRIASYIGSHGLVILENPIIALIIFILGSFFLASTLFQLLYRNFNYNLLKLNYSFYFILLLFFLFFKSVGIKGITLNPFSFIQDFLLGQSFEVIANILFFIPLGLLFNFKNISFRKTILISIFSIAIVETIQYIFSLGFFDTGDIVTNVIGVISGWFFYVFFKQLNYKINGCEMI